MRHAALVLAAYAMAGMAHAGPEPAPRFTTPRPTRTPQDDAERIAAAEAKRARKNAKRLKQAPTTGEG